MTAPVPAVPDPTVEALSEAQFVAKWDPSSFTGIPTTFRADLERILAARAAAPDALRVRIEALAAEIEDPRTQRPGMQRRRIWGDRLRALLEDGAQ